MKIDDLDVILHQPVRTKLVAYLINIKECDFSTIKNDLNLSDGHMSTHMKKLLQSEYVEMKKEFVENKPKTTYKITKLGKKKFNDYIKMLKRIIEG